MDLHDTPGIAALIDAGRRTAVGILEAKITHPKPFIVLRDADGAEQVKYLDETFEQPHHVGGTVKVQDERSFLAYFTRHATERALIYATVQPATVITAVFNEHDGTMHAPDWRDHRLQLTLAHSKEWLAWAGKNGQNNAFTGTTEFAEWLEDQLPDIVNPPNGEFLDMILQFKVQARTVFTKAQRLTDGHVHFVYNHEVEGAGIKGGQETRIPEEFTIAIPVFAGFSAEVFQMQARFRFRLTGQGGIKIWYELVRPHKVIEQAFKGIWTKIEAEANRPILLGTPE